MNHPLRNVRILAVDDDNDTREMLRYILQQAGGEVTAVQSDIGMPEYNGYALISLIRASDERMGRKTPAIALTAYTSPADEKTALASGFQKYIGKPFGPAELIDSIRNLVVR
jgi:CheY-like chemotaxis protein